MVQTKKCFQIKTGKQKIAGNHILSRNSDDSAIVQKFAEKSGFLCLLSKAVGKRQDQATGIDINFRKVNHHPLWHVKKQDLVCHAQGAGKPAVMVIFCGKDRANMVKF